MRTTTRVIAALLAITTFTSAAEAQEASVGSPSRFEFRPFVGAFVPTGDNRDLFEDAVLVGASGALHITRNLAAVATLGWSPTELKPAPVEIDVDLYQYDLGLQVHRTYPLQSGWIVTPLAGLGLGARTYDGEDIDSETDFAGYAALGAELSRGRFGVRLTARDYVTAFDGIGTDENDSEARNDLAFGAGFTVRF